MRKGGVIRILIIQAAILGGILIFINLIFDSNFFRIDLTREGRFSVSDASLEICANLNSPAVITVYFDGEMPARYRPFQDAIATWLKELSIATGDNLDYEFIDPSGDDEIRKEFLKAGWYPFQVSESVSPTEQKDFLLLPYAKVNYKGEAQIVNLVKGCVYVLPGGKAEIDVEKAIQNLEYTLLSRLYNMSREKSELIGILEGHGEYGQGSLQDLLGALSQYYSLASVSVKDGEAISPSFKVLIVAGPDSSFSERELYEIDQYLMRGGKALFMTDQQRINFDIGEMASTLTSLRSLNLDYMFMKWGIKVNYDIVQDMYCERIELSMGNPIHGPAMQSRPWVFQPIIERFPDHPVTKNLDRVLMRFAASIDTLPVLGIEKEVLLQSSNKSRTVEGTLFLDVETYAKEKIPTNLFNQGPFPMAVVLKGNFSSSFATRLQSEKEAPVDLFATKTPSAKYLSKNQDVDAPKIAIISDGEFATGQLYQGKLGGLPYDNRAFVMNLIDYLSGEGVLTQIRSKEVVIRTLDKEKMRGQAGWIRFLNLFGPISLILIFGAVRAFLRKRKNNSYQSLKT